MDRLDFVPGRAEIRADYEEGQTVPVRMHDGSMMRLYKLDDSYDPRDADAAIATLRRRYAKGQVVTGLLYIDNDEADLHALLNTGVRPLNEIPTSELCPGEDALEKLNESFR